MKKITILLSILALAACGGGSTPVSQDNTPVISGDTNNTTDNNQSNDSATQNDDNNEDLNLGNLEIPTTNISGDTLSSNELVTDMNTSISNLAEMTAAVETIIGSDALNDVANNLGSITGNTTRSKAAMEGHLDKEKAAYVVLEGTKRFKELSNEVKSQLFDTHTNLVKYFSKMFCECNTDNFNVNQMLEAFESEINQNNFGSFYEQNHYREHTLEDVDFIMSSASNGDENGGLDIVNFELDDNLKIIGATHYALHSNEIGQSEQNTADDAHFTRVINTNNAQSNMFEFIQERDEGNVHKKIEGIATVRTYAGETGNRYSDFGHFIVDAQEYENNVPTEHQQSYEPFAGGYDDKKITVLPAETINFSGKAIGTVQGRYDNTPDLRLEGNSTLVVNGENGNQTLSMQFNDWYNVTIDKNINNEQLTFTFDGAAENNYALADMEGGHKAVRIENPGNYNGRGYEENSLTKGKLKMGYYGDNGNPEEFAGVSQYVEDIPPDNEHPDGFELRVNIGFGGVVEQ